MRVLHPDIGLARLCQLLGFSRQAYYKSVQSRDSRLAMSSIVAELVYDIRCSIGNHKLGTRKLLPLINEQLEKQGQRIGRDQLFNIMDRYELKVRQRKRRKPTTTDNTHGFRRYPNLVKNLDIEQSERVWVSDITYVKVADRFMYLSLITDAYSRKIMGYRLHKDLSVEGSIKALLMAIGNRQYPKRKLIHHSDQGIQYCSHAYVNMLKTQGIFISMASKGSPHENAQSERMNGILKQEYGLGRVIDSEDKARHLIDAAVTSYNDKRPHQCLQGHTPAQIHGADNWKQDLTEGASTKIRIRKTDAKLIQDYGDG